MIFACAMCRRADRFSIQVPAKINLWLEVIGRRQDGYHELATLMLPIGIYDYLEIELNESGIELCCDGQAVPNDHRNLAWQAARLYLEEAGWKTGLLIRLEKSIPVAAGLGGGSADAAGVLLILNRICPAPMPESRLHQIAVRIGADVPFFIVRRPALCTGIGELLEIVDGVMDYPLVLIKPPVSVSTAEIFARIKLTRGQPHIRIASLLADPWSPNRVMENDLEVVTLGQVPVIGEIKRWFYDHGALGALMSGSGPTVFGVFESRGRALEVERKAQADWPDCWVKSTRVLASQEVI